jgi:hypothetical protein
MAKSAYSERQSDMAHRNKLPSSSYKELVVSGNKFLCYLPVLSLK